MRVSIDYSKVFEVLPKITGLPLRRKNHRYWYGACRVDGSPHDRHDKLVCSRDASGGITILEQGGDSMQLWRWMRAYGGCSTDREVADRLGNQLLGTLNIIAQVVGEKPLRYVSQRQLDQSLSFIGVAEDNLFLWLCQHFDRQTVIDAYKRLLITPALLKDGRIATQFWFMTRAGDICHDKLILYKPDGKRDHDYGGGRWFTTALGFGHRCYFGEHLGTDGDRFVVESEKTALLMWLNSGTTALATGGAKNLRRIKRNYILCPDYDEAGMEWIEKFPEAMVSKWWEFESGVQKGDDLGDVIYRRLMAKGDKTV